jgi:diguanylate cyclase (GGDEF)-like protein/PAS domain S-box-containing protein
MDKSTLSNADVANYSSLACRLPARADGNEHPRLLLVDDDKRVLQSVRALLAEFDFHLTSVNDGAAAIEQLSLSRFDLVLLDLAMPMVSGHEVMDFIMDREIDADVIVVSGESSIDAAIGALKRGAKGYLRKPYKPDELVNAISNALQKRELEAHNRAMALRLEHSEKLYRHLVNGSPDIIYILGPDGRFSYINDRAQELLGYTRDEVIGQHYSMLVHEADLQRAQFAFNERRVTDESRRNAEFRLKARDADGSERWFNHTLSTISLNTMDVHSGGMSGQKTSKKKEFFAVHGVARDITDRKRIEARIFYQAYHDILTGLPNRKFFGEQLDLAIGRARKTRGELAVLFIDLDRFKLVNDTLGHIKGDELLQMAATRLKDIVRQGDTLARLGGDEFTLLLPHLRDRKDAAKIAEKLLQCLEQPFILDRREVHISASIGIAVYPADGDTMDDLLRHADIAMYQVKAHGKNSHCFYDHSMQEASYKKIELQHSLRKALEHNELEMYYQPQVDVSTGKIVCAEALMRWNHPQRGVLTAGEFLPFAEEDGLILPMSDWMIHAVCRDLKAWKQQHGLVRISFNLSPQYLDRGDFVTKLSEAMALYDILPSQLEVEITENICIGNPEHAIGQLNRLGQLGVGVAIDDFGTGYSSLAYLHRFPVNTIKIDQSFVREIKQDDGHYPVVLAVISIARGLGLNVIAEGVETPCQSGYLRQMGCTTMQGYLFHRPLVPGEFSRRIHEMTVPARLND